jgi:hypothetical protein
LNMEGREGQSNDSGIAVQCVGSLALVVGLFLGLAVRGGLHKGAVG